MKKYYENHAMGWVGALLVLYGYYLNAHMNSNSWLVWCVGNFFVGRYCLSKGAYPAAVMSFALMVMNVYGYVTWT